MLESVIFILSMCIGFFVGGMLLAERKKGRATVVDHITLYVPPPQPDGSLCSQPLPLVACEAYFWRRLLVRLNSGGHDLTVDTPRNSFDNYPIGRNVYVTYRQWNMLGLRFGKRLITVQEFVRPFRVKKTWPSRWWHHLVDHTRGWAPTPLPAEFTPETQG